MLSHFLTSIQLYMKDPDMLIVGDSIDYPINPSTDKHGVKGRHIDWQRIFREENDAAEKIKLEI